ncbi:hypothetical protein [Mesorhizobium sp. B2-6-2]|uniref:hypothetical protein n=1 Tax=Mesorhizobium sp. B2-6-2 TaxID=2589915 RepID=UPI0011274A7D|nr:hypothetical protein [Mesorhizobium sp. B2-6-2]TPJ73622.1 hypothetical protein FJ419_25225 [Mesorhizobium sp. B2-6-2]
MAMMEMDPAPTAAKALNDEVAADAKAYLDSAVSTLTVPVPLLMGIGFAAYSLATKPTPSEDAKISVAGVDVPLAIAVVLVMSLNGLSLLHIARMVSLLHAAWRQESTREVVANVLLHQPNMMNPFAGAASFRNGVPGPLSWLLSLVPKLAAGALIGVCAIFLVSLGNHWPAAAGMWFTIAVLFAITMHAAGMAGVILTLPQLIIDLCGWKSLVPLIVGLAVGTEAAWRFDIAIGTPI